MAVVQNTLIGRARGRVGNAVFTTWKSLNILKQKPEIVANPRSAGQIVARARFVMLLQFGKLLRPILQMGMREYAGTMSWLNKFMSSNALNDFLLYDALTTEWAPDWNNLVVAEGSIFPSTFVGVGSITDVDITWPATPINNQSSGDLAYAVAIGTGDQDFSLGAVDRSTGTLNIPLVSAVADSVYVALFFMNPTTLKVSSSSVLEIVIT